MTRVLIADDHAVLRAGLKQFLTEDGDIREVGEAANVRSAFPTVRALVVSGFPERQYALNMLRAIRQGRRYISATLADLLVNDIDANADITAYAVRNGLMQ